MTMPPTPPDPRTMREQADDCCDHCRALEGVGPWCMCCGAEWSDYPHDTGGLRFTYEPCDSCCEAIAARVVGGGEQ